MHKYFIKGLNVIIEFLIVNLAFIINFYFFHEDEFIWLNKKYLNFLFVYDCLWILIVIWLNLYAIRRVVRIERQLKTLLKAIVMHSFAVSTYWLLFKTSYYSRAHILITFVSYGLSIIVWRFIAINFIKIYRSRGNNLINTAIIGKGKVGQEVERFLKSDEAFGYNFLGFFDDKPENNSEVISDLVGFEDKVNELKIKEVYIALPDSATEKVVRIIEYCEQNLIRVKIIPDFTRYIKKKVTLDFYGSIPMVLIRQEPLQSVSSRIIKRIFDIAFALLVFIVLLWWLYPLVGIIIKITSPGPILFKQMRSGKENGEFLCYKFRSMHVNKESDKLQASKSDPRIHAFGRFLRKSSLDEMPQFINVLIGNMSVVGPRPHMVKHTEEYSEIINKYMVRHFVKPGITGWAQVNGFRGETKSKLQMENRVKSDVWYIENWSLLLDIKIIIKTIINAVKGEENAY